MPWRGFILNFLPSLLPLPFLPVLPRHSLLHLSCPVTMFHLLWEPAPRCRRPPGPAHPAPPRSNLPSSLFVHLLCRPPPHGQGRRAAALPRCPGGGGGVLSLAPTPPPLLPELQTGCLHRTSPKVRAGCGWLLWLAQAGVSASPVLFRFPSREMQRDNRLQRVRGCSGGRMRWAQANTGRGEGDASTESP